MDKRTEKNFMLSVSFVMAVNLIPYFWPNSMQFISFSKDLSTTVTFTTSIFSYHY